jgi:hypothetical protein
MVNHQEYKNPMLTNSDGTVLYVGTIYQSIDFQVSNSVVADNFLRVATISNTASNVA